MKYNIVVMKYFGSSCSIYIYIYIYNKTVLPRLRGFFFSRANFLIDFTYVVAAFSTVQLLLLLKKSGVAAITKVLLIVVVN